MESSSDWANAPRDILHSILDKLLPLLNEYARFGCVCKPWLAVAIENSSRFMKRYKMSHDRLPALLIPTKDEAKRDVYSLMAGKVCSFQFRLPIDTTGASGCCAEGWIATWNKNTEGLVVLVNPFLNKTIRLPPLYNKIKHQNPNTDFTSDIDSLMSSYAYSSYTTFRVRSVIAMPLPSSSSSIDGTNFIVAVLFGRFRRLAYIKTGNGEEDMQWTFPTNIFMPLILSEFIFHKGRILCLDSREELFVVDVTTNKNKTMKLGGIEWGLDNLQESYLAESSSTGDLLLLRRFDEFRDGITSTRFKIFRVNPEQIEGNIIEGDGGSYRKLEMINSLGDDAVFLGDNCSMCTRASDVIGCKPNCIYYWENEINIDITSEYKRRRLFSMDTDEMRDVCSAEDTSIIRPRRYDDDGSYPRPFWIFLPLPRFFKSGIIIDAAAAESSSVKQPQER